MTKKIFLIGAGRSATVLIQYLLETCAQKSWHLTIGDANSTLADQKLGGHSSGTAIEIDINDTDKVASIVRESDLVISMLPPGLHGMVASTCLFEGVHLLTASYLTEELYAMDIQAKAKDIIMLNECGLDPGIDHMSAMKVLDDIREKGGEITGFESFTGGLLAPNNDDNPWEYKFTWNPRNVVMAGNGEVKFVQEGRYKYIPYPKLFQTN